MSVFCLCAGNIMQVDLLFTGQGRIAPLLISAALQNRLTAGIVSRQLTLWRKALRTGVQGCNTNALQH